MWLLSTDQAVLRYFESPEDVPGGYAILSHVWEPAEDNFQDMMKLREEHIAGMTPDPISRVREKTKRCCQLARSQGFQYVWIDSCCVDRSHTAELAKDIRSQFLYFSLAHVCYAYLFDVPSGCDLRVTDSPFRTSKWHTTPWTLQELIAPDMVIFYSKEWTVLGTKQNLAPLLEEITAVPASVLTFDNAPASFSVAARMSWASQRRPTARQEGQAYSLLGIMGVNMDVPYGEGRRAFQRLQEEITKQLADTSVFVWGDKPALSFPEVVRLVRDLPPVPAAHTHHPDESFLFAPAPSAFKSGFAEAQSTPRLPIGNTTYALDTSNLLTFTVTSNDVLARLPVIELSQQRVLIAFISCTMDKKPLGLVLERCPNTSGGVPLYDVGLDDSNGGTFRLVTLDGVSVESTDGGRAGGVTFVWRTIHIRGRHVHDPSQDFQRIPMNRDLSSFYLPRLLLKKFGGRCLLRKPFVSTDQISSLSDPKASSSAQPAATLTDSSAQHALSAGTSLGTESLPATFLFFADSTSRRLPFLVHFGRCTGTNGSSTESGAHWANVQRYEDVDAEGVEFQPSIPTHACPADHISGWQNQQRTFPIAFSPITHGIRLSFSEAFGTTRVLVPDIVTLYKR